MKSSMVIEFPVIVTVPGFFDDSFVRFVYVEDAVGESNVHFSKGKPTH